MAKIIKNKTYTVVLDHEEFGVIKALLQNPHPEYMKNSEMRNACQDLFETFKEEFEGYDL